MSARDLCALRLAASAKWLHCRPFRPSKRWSYSLTGGLRRPGIQNVGPPGLGCMAKPRRDSAVPLSLWARTSPFGRERAAMMTQPIKPFRTLLSAIRNQGITPFRESRTRNMAIGLTSVGRVDLDQRIDRLQRTLCGNRACYRSRIWIILSIHQRRNGFLSWRRRCLWGRFRPRASTSL